MSRNQKNLVYYLRMIIGWPLLIVCLLGLSYLVLPLFYMCFIVVFIVVPPIIFIEYGLREKPPEGVSFKKHVLTQFVSCMFGFPLMLLMIISIFRSAILILYSFAPPFMEIFNQVHHESIYSIFIPHFGELFPYWLDIYLGVIGVIVFYTMTVLDSRSRSMLSRQIENLPTSRINAAAIGLVELKGKAYPVNEDEMDEAIMLTWTEMKEGMVSSNSYTKPFYLDDGTGRVLVDPGKSSVSGESSIFDSNLHQVILKEVKGRHKQPEGRLMPGDNVYVLGNLQINDDEDDPENKVVIKPKRSSWLPINFYDVFLVSNKSEAALLKAFGKSVKRGWRGASLLILLISWMVIHGWTNIVQVKAQDLEAAPYVFRLITPETEFERGLK